MEEIIKLCDSLIEHKKCKQCGGSKYEDGICVYCQIKDEEINTKVEQITNLLNNDPSNADILLSLKSIEFTGDKRIFDYLNKYNFDTYLLNRFNVINDKINNNQIDEFDLNYIYYFIENHYYTKESKEYIANFIMSKLITKSISLSLEQKIKFIKFFTETHIQVFYPKTTNPKCIIESKDKDVLGDSFYNIITLDKEQTIKYLENDNYIMLLILIYHESTHCFQKYRMKSKNELSTYINLLEVKEEIISQKIPNYYNENYQKFSQEVEARYESYELILMYLESKGLVIGKNGLEWIKQEMEKDYKLIFDETRTLNSKNTTVDEVFDSIEISYELFKNYPVLSLEYKYVDGKLVRKSKEELTSDYATFIPNDKVDYLYEKLLNKTEMKMI